MTEKENLERCGDIDVLIKDLERRIEKTEQEIAELSEKVVADCVRGGSGGRRLYRLEGTEDTTIEKRRKLLEERIKKLNETKLEKERILNRAYTFLDTVRSTEIRMMLQYFYIDNLSWYKVAIKMEKETGKSYSKAQCQMRCTRFLKNIEEKAKKN